MTQRQLNVFLVVTTLVTLAAIPITASVMWWWHEQDRQAESIVEQSPSGP